MWDISILIGFSNVVKAVISKTFLLRPCKYVKLRATSKVVRKLYNNLCICKKNWILCALVLI